MLLSQLSLFDASKGGIKASLQSLPPSFSLLRSVLQLTSNLWARERRGLLWHTHTHTHSEEGGGKSSPCPCNWWSSSEVSDQYPTFLVRQMTYVSVCLCARVCMCVFVYFLPSLLEKGNQFPCRGDLICRSRAQDGFIIGQIDHCHPPRHTCTHRQPQTHTHMHTHKHTHTQSRWFIWY